jgi:hypothetical protein
LSPIVAAKVFSMIASILGGDDDEEEQKEINKTWWEKAVVSVPTQIAADVMSSTMGYIGIVFANVFSSIVYERVSFLPLVVSPAQDVVNEAKSGMKKDATRFDQTAMVIGSSLAILQWGGIPFYSLYRYAMRALELVPDAPKTEREKLWNRIKKRKESLEKMRSN